ncbi:hypothetical protein NE237_030263 [Protea cynaroides]|uniref:Uncharacterized protein n=1 Tax=Protea cynaroides TaxID=273540 RepID=A0A9Q0JVL2_9MAGN|nr:hypothetical protein NE237_030263 [Protea cynaroides]
MFSGGFWPSALGRRSGRGSSGYGRGGGVNVFSIAADNSVHHALTTVLSIPVSTQANGNAVVNTNSISMLGGFGARASKVLPSERSAIERREGVVSKSIVFTAGPPPLFNWSKAGWDFPLKTDLIRSSSLARTNAQPLPWIFFLRYRRSKPGP